MRDELAMTKAGAAMPTGLSAAGATRRDALRAALARRVVHRRRRRRALQTVVVVAATAMLVWHGSTGARRDRPVSVPVASGTGAIAFVVAVDRDDPQIVERLRIEAAPRVTVLDDEALVATLAQNGRAAGVVRIGDQVSTPGLVADHWQ